MLRQLGHEVIAMENYAAECSIPLNKALKDVSSCDVFVSIAAWRYRYVPTIGSDDIPGAMQGTSSITEYEYSKAVQGWSTRLYLLVAVGQEKWNLQRIIILENQKFTGIVSAASVRSVLRRIHKEAEKFDVRVLPTVTGADVRQIAEKWSSIIGAQPGDVSAERDIAQNVTVQNLRLWFGRHSLRHLRISER
ncbi:MAG: DUF4062 domain-containing protein [Candidatus Thiodiazotropha sp.]